MVLYNGKRWQAHYCCCCCRLRPSHNSICIRLHIMRCTHFIFGFCLDSTFLWLVCVCVSVCVCMWTHIICMRSLKRRVREKWGYHWNFTIQKEWYYYKRWQMAALWKEQLKNNLRYKSTLPPSHRIIFFFFLFDFPLILYTDCDNICDHFCIAHTFTYSQKGPYARQVVALPRLLYVYHVGSSIPNCNTWWIIFGSAALRRMGGFVGSS